jgi:hypothetical protein
MMSEEKLKEKITDIKKKIVSLEWDKQHNQLNFAKDALLNEYKEQLEKIEAELNA